jgi:hypothetical protein
MPKNSIILLICHDHKLFDLVSCYSLFLNSQQIDLGQLQFMLSVRIIPIGTGPKRCLALPFIC